MKKSIVKAFVLTAILGLSGSAFAADGAALYASKCTACHGANGVGAAMGPAFKGSEFIKTTADADIAAVITKGRSGADKKYKQFALGMPAQKLTDEEATAIVAHLKALAAK
jgi:mono/diheme cytochrome c family protein